MTSIPIIRFDGAIMPPGRQGGVNLDGLDPLLVKAFARKRTQAVALVINCPGGSPVQSSLIAQRIRELADRNNTRVLAFVEDVAASGGYWLACAADEIYADPASIIGSIGVVSAGFGFEGAIKKLGITRRAHTAGANKMRLDPFQGEKDEDVAWLKDLQLKIHDEFKTHVLEARGAKLGTHAHDLMTGEVWLGRQALNLGLIDGLGTVTQVLKSKFGPRVKTRAIRAKKSFLSRLPFVGASTQRVLTQVEERTLFARFGL